jgi:hypothetical protein
VFCAFKLKVEVRQLNKKTKMAAMQPGERLKFIERILGLFYTKLMIVS